MVELRLSLAHTHCMHFLDNAYGSQERGFRNFLLTLGGRAQASPARKRIDPEGRTVKDGIRPVRFRDSWVEPDRAYARIVRCTIRSLRLGANSKL
jgi:hypothetical protein